MEIDPNSPVVRLCAEGIGVEMAGRLEEAALLYGKAWDARVDDYDACIAAHYQARVQPTPQAALRWNEKSLHHADAVNDDRVKAFYPSLYLNMGKAHEDLGNMDEAKRFYELAAEKAAVLSEGGYADTVKRGIMRGLERVSNQDIDRK